MTDKNIDTRIKKLEERYRDLKDITREANASIEDLYDSINNLKAPTSDRKNGKCLDDTENETYTKTNNDNDNDNDNDKQLKTKSITTNKQSLDIDKVLNKLHLAVDTEIYEHAKLFLKYLESLLYCQSESSNINVLLEYFIELPNAKRLDILEKLHQHDTANSTINIHNKPKLITILESSLSLYHQQMALNKLHILENMDNLDPEYWKLSQWLDNLLAIPFNKYLIPFTPNTPNTPNTPTNSIDNNVLESVSDIFVRARKILDSVIYGQSQTKEHMLEIIARMISNPSTCGTVFAVEGMPGCGKTTLIKEGLTQIMGLPFEFISLGGANEMAYLAGQNYTYIGSMPGKIIQGLKQAKCMNPIFYFDELDKVSATERGQEIMNLLIHLTDPSQNGHFQDLYMDGIPVDLSRAIFVFSFNDRRRVSPILLDRMEVIKFNTYTPVDKTVIIERYLIPKIMKKYFGTRSTDIKCILRDKKKIMQNLISSRMSKESKMRNSNKRMNRRMNRNRNRNMNMDVNNHIRRNRNTNGIRTIIRKLEKAIARINLQHLEMDRGSKIKMIKKIVLTPRLFSSRISNKIRFTFQGVPVVR